MSPPEGTRALKKHKRNEVAQFPVCIYDAKPENFSKDVPTGVLGFQGRAYTHHFNTDRQQMRTEHAGRVSPFHAEYMSCPTLTNTQKALIDALCLLTDGIYMCHFCPDGARGYSAYADSPLREDNVYDSAAELHEHVCLYHYPFVHAYDCGYCEHTVASFPKHIKRTHDGLFLHG